MNKLIIYHASCMDGLCAAWILHTHKGGAFEDAELYPAQYGQSPPDVTGKDVIIVDFSYKRADLVFMYEKAKHLQVLDHHKSAQADLEGLPFCTFDMNRSGAMMAADWQGLKEDDPKRTVAAYVQDRDLWRWELPGSRELSAFLRSMGFKDFDGLECLRDAISAAHFTLQCVEDGLFSFDDGHERVNESGLRDLYAQGYGILRMQERMIEELVSHAVVVRLGGCAGYAVNCSSSNLMSEIANRLAHKEHSDFGACYFIRDDGLVQWSLRSHDGAADVSEIASLHFGGGHRNSAGMSTHLDILSQALE